MKELILLISLLILNWNAFSQNVTRDSARIIRLDRPVALAAAKDLLQGDACKQELSSLYQITYAKDQIIKTKDDIIEKLNAQAINYESIIVNQEKQMGLQDKFNKSLQATLKKEQRKVFWYRSGTVIGVAAVATILLLK